MVYVKRLANGIAEVFSGIPSSPEGCFKVDKTHKEISQMMSDGMLKITEDGVLYVEPYPEPEPYTEPEPYVDPLVKAFKKGLNSI